MIDPSARIVEAVDDLGEARNEWDELAVAAGSPYSSPAWALAWWRHLRPSGARLRIVLVYSGDRLVGVLPLFRRGRTHEQLGRGMASAEPLVAAEVDLDSVVGAAGATLRSANPKPLMLRFERLRSASDWLPGLCGAWPAANGATRIVEATVPVPYVTLGDYEQWMKQRSATFQREMRRKHRKLESAGGRFRYADSKSLERDIGDFLRLHRSRLAGRGGTSLGAGGVGEMLTEVGAALLPGDRFRLLCLEVDGETIAAQLLVAAGTEVSGWNTGFDDQYSKLSPLMLCMLRSIADAAVRGEKTMSLGPGAQGYKYRLTEDEDSQLTTVVIPPGVGRPLVRSRLAAARLVASVRRRAGRLRRR